MIKEDISYNLMDKQYGQNELPSDVFNSTSGDVRNFNGQQVRVVVNQNGTRTLQPIGGSSISGGGGGGGFDYNSAIQSALAQYNQINEPAISSYKSQIPELQQQTQHQVEQIQGEKQPLIDRYTNLINTLKGQQTTETNRQTVTTRNELGRRGITSDSGLAEQELTNALNPITERYSGQIKDVGLSQEGDLRDLANRAINVQDTGTNNVRTILNALAGITSGGAGFAQNSANTLLSAFQQDQQRQQQASQFSQEQQRLRDQISADEAYRQKVYQNIELPKTTYAINAPYYKPEGGGSGGIDISSILKEFGVTGSTKSAPKPTFNPTTKSTSLRPGQSALRSFGLA